MNSNPPSIFGSLFGGHSQTAEYLKALQSAQEFLNRCDQEELELLRSQPLNDLVN